MPTGIEIRGETIRISVQFKGQRLRFGFALDGTKRAHVQQAEKIRKKMIAEISAGTFSPSDYCKVSPNERETENKQVETFHDLTTEYLLGIKGNDLAGGTKKKYHQAANFWNRQLAAWSTHDLTYSNLKRRVDSIQWPGPKTRNNHISVLRGMLQIWMDDKKISENPAQRLKNSKYQKPVPDPLTATEVDAILDYMKSNFPEPISNYFEFMFFSGLRPEETIALRCEDVMIGTPGVSDFVHVSKALTAGEEKPTKTYSARDVQLNGRSKAAVTRQLKLAQAVGLEHLFFNPNTNLPWASEKFQRTLYWYPALVGCGIRKRVAYQTRHTYASLSLSAGAQPLWLSTQMGHSTPKMIYERYARWVNGASNSQEHMKIENMFVAKGLSQNCPRKE